MYKDSFLQVYLNDLAAKKPAPGGGSAASLAGALAAALMSMVCNFTIGKEKYKDVQDRINKILQKSEKARGKLLELVDLDCIAYQSKDLQKALDVPMQVCHLSNELANLCPELAEIGNVNLISDVRCAYDLLLAAFKSARINVEVNLKNLIDNLKKEELMQELNVLGEGIEKVREEVDNSVGKIIRR